MADTLHAIARFRHNGEWLRVGDEVTNITDDDREALLRLGYIERRKLTLGGMAKSLSSAVDTLQQKPRRNTYQRRDMQAEDGE